MDRTRVYITVDVECAEERRTKHGVQPKLDYELRMWGRLANQRRDLGVPLILEELDGYGLKGTFFLEALGSHSFGLDGLREVATAIHRSGHDVQLHTHPVQRSASWISRGEAPAKDDIGAYPLFEQAALLREGVDILATCGVPKEELLAFRAGNFGASNDTWAAMRDAGLVLSSNYNPCYFSKNCKMRTDRAQPGLFETEVQGVYELPISCFQEPAGGIRHLQITAVSHEEMVHCLEASRRLGIRELTIVTHSFEFFFLDSIDRRTGHPNRMNIGRLRNLCRFLAERDDAFEVETVGALARRLPAPVTLLGAALPRTTPTIHARRLAEQAVKRLSAAVPI